MTCICPKPFTIRGQTFTPSPSQNCPIHAMFSPDEESEPLDRPDPQELAQRHAMKIKAAPAGAVADTADEAHEYPNTRMEMSL